MNEDWDLLVEVNEVSMGPPFHGLLGGRKSRPYGGAGKSPVGSKTNKKDKSRNLKDAATLF
jgi:hypothetical protein